MAGDDPFAFLETQQPPKPLEQSKSIRKLNWGSQKFAEKFAERSAEKSTTEKSTDKSTDQRTKWREKLFSKDRDAKHAAETERQLNDFLGTNGPRPPPEAPTLPAIDFGTSPSQSQVLSTTPPSPKKNVAPAASQDTATASPPKKRRPKGLRVAFSDRKPDVIGEGGDESEDPTITISQNKARRPSQPDESQQIESYENLEHRRPTLPNLQLDTSFAGGDDSLSGGGKSEKDPSWKPLLLSPQDQDLLMAFNAGERGSRLSLRASSDTNSFAKRVQARMQAEEGLALHNRVDDEPVSPTTETVENEGLPKQLQPQEPPPTRPSFTSQRSQLSQQSLAVDDGISSSLSLRTSPVPAVHEQAKMLRQEFSAELQSPGSSASSISPPPDEQKMAAGIPTELPRPPSSRDTTESPRPTVAAAPRSAKMTLRSVANAMGDNAYQDFTTHVEKYTSLYHLAAESVKPLMETSFPEWVRASTWWFLKGRSGLETAVRSGLSPVKSVAEQAVVDLGKAWWICTDIVPNHPEITRYGKMSMDALAAVISTTGDQRLATLVNLHQKVINHLRALTVSMKRNQILTTMETQPNTNGHAIDSTIWLRYPFFAPDVAAAFSGSNRRSMLIDSTSHLASTPDMMLLGDTSRFFSYGTMFVEVSLAGDEDYDSPQYAIQCILSIKRDRNDWYVLGAISSQTELVNILIQSDRKNGPTWDDVRWHVKTRTMTVKLRRGFELNVAFEEKDFKMIWNIVQYTLKTEASLQPEAGETKIFHDTLKVFQYMDSGTPKAFPPEPSPLCRMALFEKTVTVTEGTGSRKAHRGFRLAVVTNPQTKTLSSVRHTLGYGAPIVFGYLRGENGAPALLLNLKEDSRARSLVLTFDRIEQRTLMHSLLLGMLANEKETTSANLPIRSYTIDQPGDSVIGTRDVSHVKFNAGSVSVINLEPDFIDHNYPPNVLSENLRVLVSTDWGTITDRINIGPGEMKIGLDTNFDTALYMYRAQQEDMTVSIAENLVEKELPDRLTQFLEAAKTKPMIRRYEFSSLETLHAFQEIITGYRVVYDGMAVSFAISRRRMVVPIHKKWEASSVRLQLVRQNKTVQLLAFFGNDFSHGKCMNFVLKGTDTYESANRSGKIGVRIVDAKFALPKREEEEASRFVCLDMPEYPSEHDDITISFESEQERTKFHSALPGVMRAPARMASMRR
ncbi:Protein stoned-B [Talaromyces islandicus]|uniref:Protein stoned-B n=1 Tax=Talaromyces islandicus TaxID=28573 RepID=A0A0U1M7L8_TALIS|nr:Protein stoned-B [Talaromyces islandicus]